MAKPNNRSWKPFAAWKAGLQRKGVWVDRPKSSQSVGREKSPRVPSKGQKFCPECGKPAGHKHGGR